LERDRLAWIFLKRNIKTWDRILKPLLHIAPEPIFFDKFRQRLGTKHITADLYQTNVDIRMDITQIQFPDGYFGAIYCSHVFEHVSNDKLAMREFKRVLAPEGWALLCVPITADKTFEDLTISDPQERIRLFGQDDHIRRYGSDLKDRLEQAGFAVEPIAPQDFLTTAQIMKMGLGAANGLFLCR